VYEHRHKLVPGFTKKYTLSEFVDWQATDGLEFAISRENQINERRGSKNPELIEATNSPWMYLAD